MRFIVDVMLGSLARYMRIAGLDVLYDNNYEDRQILKIAKDQKRTVLSRDSLMFKRREFTKGIVDFLFIENDSLKKQLNQVKTELDIDLGPRFSRCIECNHLLEAIDKKDVEGKVPTYVYKTQSHFMFCPDCIKYYWRGTHYENIVKRMRQMV